MKPIDRTRTSYKTLADRLWHNLKYDGLRPSRDIWVGVLGTAYEVGNLERYVAQFPIDRGIDIFIPTMPECNRFSSPVRHRHRFWCVGGVTVSRVSHTQGNKAPMVYVVGLDRVAEGESNPQLRNRLVVALMRSIGWVRVSGVENYSRSAEFDRVIRSGETLSLTFARPPSKPMERTEMGEWVRRYAPGRESLAGADLTGAQLGGMNLLNADLMGTQLVAADVTGAILVGASLKGAKLVGAILPDARLTGADYIGANLGGVDLTELDLSETPFDRANLADAIVSEVRDRTVSGENG